MADDNRNPEYDLQQKKIPVFTVLKNNSILKNIFLLDKPPSISDSTTTISTGNESNHQFEEILIVGRHPDCDITLEHPSISRYHLRIHSKPSSQNLSVVDLSSVHGTRVCGKKIEPGVLVHLNEGDSMQLGGSSRVYMLHWVPLSRAYDLDDPFVPPLEAPVTISVRETAEQTHQDEEVMALENNQMQPADDELEGLGLLLPNKNLKSYLKKVSPLAPQMPNLLHSSYDDDENTNQYQDVVSIGNSQIQSLSNELEGMKFLLPMKALKSCLKKASPLPQNLLHFCYNNDNQDEAKNQNLSRKEHEFQECQVKTPPPPIILEVHFATGDLENTQNFNQLECSKHEEEGNYCSPIIESEPAEISGLACGSIGTGISSLSSSITFQLPGIKNIFNVDYSSTGKSSEKSSLENSSESVDSQSSLRKDKEQKRILHVLVNGRLVESNTPQSLAFAVTEEYGKRSSLKYEDVQKNILKMVEGGQYQNEGPESPIMNSEEQSDLPSIWLRGGKPKNRGKAESVDVDDMSEPMKQDNVMNKCISKTLFDEDGEETFTPDKENFTPNTVLPRSTKYKDQLEEHTSTSFKNAILDTSQEANLPACSDIENQTHNNELGLMKRSRVVTRMPFQSLPDDSATKKSNFINHPQSIENNVGQENKKWIMVVDTTSLLNKESRKALQLLQGLKGTRLIIPRIVLRELESMRRRGILFRRNTDVTSASQWIKECMLKTKWWIHVQSTSEETRPLAPTPTTLSPFDEESDLAGFFPCGGLLQIVSPTVEDHILECALAFRHFKHNGHLVLLSNDVSLKINAMAKGLLCEKAQEFREKLVNPFSERFLWVNSLPRGPTWCCKEDIVLKEKYECYRLKKKPSKIGAVAVKGLKLILLHSSQYRQQLLY